MNPIALTDIRHCFEGIIVSTLATSSIDGVPNIIYLSDACYLDCHHVALSYQFFNKTRRNILANPRASLLVTDPRSLHNYTLTLQYLRTEEQGPVFETMKARLAAIAEWTGMSAVFRLRGADIYRVLHIRQEDGPALPPTPQPPAPSPWQGMRWLLSRLQQSQDLNQLVDTSMSLIGETLNASHALLLLPDEHQQSLFAIGSRGYESSGIGAEVGFGQGLIGICASQQALIRVNHHISDYVYSHAIRQDPAAGFNLIAEQSHIPLPALAVARSRMAVPVLFQSRLQAVIYLESETEDHFSVEDEDRLQILAEYLALAIRYLESRDQGNDRVVAATPANTAVTAVIGVPPDTKATTSTEPLAVRFYQFNQSLFVNDDYLIKGVAGSLLWHMLNDHHQFGRCEFSNRELRLDQRIGLPELSANLETRLLLLQRRLQERCPQIVIQRTGRGRFRLEVDTPLQLVHITQS